MTSRSCSRTTATLAARWTTSTRCAATPAARRSTPTCTAWPPRAIPSACSARSTSSRVPASASCRPCCRCSASLPLPPDAFRFLEYHGQNDEHHLARWLAAVELALDCDEDGRAERRIVDTARRTAALYLMQFHHVMEDEAQ